MNEIKLTIEVTISADYKEEDLREKSIWAVNEMCYRLENDYFPIHNFIGYKLTGVKVNGV
ncbi:MAG TPA: hypothetical protein VII99_10705 [Bacteroidia bacterium]